MLSNGYGNAVIVGVVDGLPQCGYVRLFQFFICVDLENPVSGCITPVE